MKVSILFIFWVDDEQQSCRSTGGIRCTLCVSSQVGCDMGCTFCATGMHTCKSFCVPLYKIDSLTTICILILETYFGSQTMSSVYYWLCIIYYLSLEQAIAVVSSSTYSIICYIFNCRLVYNTTTLVLNPTMSFYCKFYFHPLECLAT